MAVVALRFLPDRLQGEHAQNKHTQPARARHGTRADGEQRATRSLAQELTVQRPGPAGGEGDAPSRSASLGCNAPLATARRRRKRPAQPAGLLARARVHATRARLRRTLALRALALRAHARSAHTCQASQLAYLSTLPRVQLGRDGALSGTQTARAEACSTLGSSLPTRARIRASARLRPLGAQSARTADSPSA